MKSRRFKRGDNHEDKTPEKDLAKWRRYYYGHHEYHLGRNRKYYLNRMFDWYDFFRENGYGECEICGFSEHPRAIDFHHIDPKEKTFGIGKFINGRQCNAENQAIIKEEISKCQCLCANCHRIKHFVMANPDKD